MLIIVRFVLALYLGIGAVYAQVPILDCYQKTGLKKYETRPVVQHLVLLDETTAFDDNLKKSIATKLLGLLAPGAEITVLKFSAFVQDHYAQLIYSGRLAVPLTQAQWSETKKPLSQAYEQCIAIQKIRAERTLNHAANRYFVGASSSIARSDIAGTLSQVAAPFLARSEASRKVIFLVSDMLENSSVSTFYRKNAIRRIDPAAEIAKVEQAGLIADLSGAEVFVLGAGVISINPKDPAAESYRDPLTMRAIKTFWEEYFKKSNARLIAFGQPELLAEVK